VITEDKKCKVKCRYIGCEYLFDDDSLKKVCDEETYNKFKKFIQEKEYVRNELTRQCPNSKCSKTLVEASSKNTTKLKCQAC